MTTERACLGRAVGTVLAGVSASAAHAVIVHSQAMTPDAATPTRAKTAQLTAKNCRASVQRAFVHRSSSPAVHRSEMALETGVLGRGVLALVAEEAVARAPVRRLPVSFHASLPAGREVAFVAFEANAWEMKRSRNNNNKAKTSGKKCAEKSFLYFIITFVKRLNMVLEGTGIGSLIVALVTKEFATLNVNLVQVNHNCERFCRVVGFLSGISSPDRDDF